MRSVSSAAAVLLFGLAWLVAAGAARGQATTAVDPDWGIYAQLAGREGIAGPDTYRLRWEWETPGEVLLEHWVAPDGRTAYSSRYTPGEKTGELRQKSTALGRESLGQVQPDGAVVFVGTGLMKLPTRTSIVNGEYRSERVKLRDGVVASVQEANPRYRWKLGQPASIAAAAAVPATTAPSASLPGAAAPIAAATPPPQAADFGPFERFIGRQLVSDDRTLDVYLENGALALHEGIPPAQRVGRYLVRAGATPGTYELLETTISGTRNRVARFEGDELVLEYTIPGYHERARFKVVGDAIEYDLYEGNRYFASINGVLEFARGETYRPATQGLLDAAVADYQRDLAYDAMMQQRREQEFAAQQYAIGAALGGAADDLAYEAQRQAEQDAFIAQVQARAEQTAAAEAQAPAGQTAAAAGEAAASPAPDAQAAQASTGGAMIELESDAPPASAPEAPAPAPRQMFLVCVVLKPTAFDQHTGALFFSGIVESGFDSTLAARASGSFAAKVLATHGVRGAPICQTHDDHQSAERAVDEWRQGNAQYKHVFTGMTPL